MSARCATVDPEVWFEYEDYRRDSKIRKEKTDVAKTICGRCPLLDPCRRYGLATRQEYGIWGGLDEDDRENVLAGGRDATSIPLHVVVEDSTPAQRLEITHGEMKAA